MKRALMTIMVLTIIAGLVYVIGCSDDDETSTGSTTKPTGDTLDPTFIGAKQALSDVSDSVPLALNAMINGMWGVLDSMASLPSAKPTGILQPDTVWFNGDNNYWYAIEENTGLFYSYQIDSLQFMQGEIAVQWPDTALLTRINGGMFAAIRYGSVAKATSGDTVFKYTFQGSLFGDPGSIARYGDVAVNASGTLYMNKLLDKNTSDIFCGYELDDTYQVNNVQLNLLTVFEFGGCPVSGNITHNAALSLTCGGDTTFTNTDNWYAQQSFTGDSTHYVIENSTHRWEMTEGCGGGDR